MKEFEHTFDEGLFTGLRKDDEGLQEDLTECFNVMPIDGGVELHEALTSLDAAGITWKE